MLQKTLHTNGIITFQSPLLTAANIRHAFSTRVGGISLKPYDTLNLGNPSGCGIPDTALHLDENYRRLQDAIGASSARRAWVRQVHGTAIALIVPEGESEYGETLEAEIRDRFCGQTAADAMLTDQSNILLSIRVADCFPILLASPDGRVVAAVHAGWRGVVNGMISNAVRAFVERNVNPATILAAIGPGIGAAHFEVGRDVADEFRKAALGFAVQTDMDVKPHVDLQAAIVRQLKSAGVPQIDASALCTYSDRNLFFSHRRENGQTGRMAAVILPRQALLANRLCSGSIGPLQTNLNW